MKFKFDCVFYYVSDLSRSTRFYADVLGFRLVSQDAVARFGLDGVLFELVPTDDPAKLKAAAGLCLQVNDMSEAVANLQSKGIQTTAPEMKEGGILSSFKDPDGNQISLWQYTGR
jgi:catechol 2,3-dioxygenase-like lactoylglutathione lyase family enzyme